MRGKEKCKILKEIRQQIALENDIEWVVDECRHKGECKGTCPKCEREVRKLERELERRRKLGKTVALVGISTVCLTGLAGCGIGIGHGPGNGHGPGDDLAGAIDIVSDPPEEIVLDGEVALPDGYMEIPTDEYDLSGDVPVEWEN